MNPWRVLAWNEGEASTYTLYGVTYISQTKCTCLRPSTATCGRKDILQISRGIDQTRRKQCTRIWSAMRRSRPGTVLRLASHLTRPHIQSVRDGRGRPDALGVDTRSSRITDADRSKRHRCVAISSAPASAARRTHCTVNNYCQPQLQQQQMLLAADVKWHLC